MPLAAWQYLSQIHFPFRASSNVTATGPAIRRKLAQQSDCHRRSNPWSQAQQSDCHRPSNQTATCPAFRRPQVQQSDGHSPQARQSDCQRPCYFLILFKILLLVLYLGGSEFRSMVVSHRRSLLMMILIALGCLVGVCKD